MDRRNFLWALAPLSTLAGAQSVYPDKPVRLIIPFAPGNLTDSVTRLFADRMGAELGQSFIVDNRPGALGTLGSAAAQRSAPDGYTLLLTANGTTSAATALFKSLPYDPVRSFAHIGRIMIVPWVLAVSPSLPVNTLDEFITYVRRNPGKLSAGYTSSSSRFAVQGLLSQADLQVQQVPYKSPAQLFVDLRNREVQFAFFTPEVALGQTGSEQFKVLGVSAPRRWPSLPQVPAIADRLPGFEVVSWSGLAAPAGTPPDVLDRLKTAMNKVLSSSDFQERVRKLGADAAPVEKDTLAALIQSEIAAWAKFARDVNLKPE